MPCLLFKFTPLILLFTNLAFGEEFLIPKKGATKIQAKDLGSLDFKLQKELLGQKVTFQRIANKTVMKAVHESKKGLQFEPAETDDVVEIQLPNLPGGKSIAATLKVKNSETKKLPDDKVYTVYYYASSNEMFPIPSTYDPNKQEIEFDLPTSAFMENKDHKAEVFLVIGIADVFGP
ncbi:MAG: hypothetical protein AB7N80_01945 [Bdellovibrionales bacterium]